MTEPLKICFAASELAPFAKTGGLADVAGALPRELARQGHDVRPFVPLHASIDRSAVELQPVDFLQNVAVKMGWRTSTFSVLAGRARDTDPSVYFVDCPEMFHRASIYTSDPDEPRRFGLFSRAVIESCQRMGWGPDVFHCNDWHTALIPLLLETVYDWDTLFHPSKTAMTIHNIGYQGVFSNELIRDLGMDAWGHRFDHEDMRAGRVNLLKTGLLYADVITAVSPTYAREIQTGDYGMGLESLLRSRGDRLVGILNGVDYDEWNPESDPRLPAHFSASDLDGKRENKRRLLESMGLPADNGAPLLGVISRLTPQKGFDLCFPVLPELLATRDVRMTLLGTGDRKYEEFFQWLEERFPDQVSYYRGYSEELAHRIEAGSDMFLMPSRYEPCGLNQMFSMRYGTVPIVRRTGGLADSVQLFDPSTGEGTGFVFDHFSPTGLHWALDAALDTYRNRKAWHRLVRNAMAANFSWENQARQYSKLYRWLVGRS